MSKFCTDCGTQLEDAAKFCAKCGKVQTVKETQEQLNPNCKIEGQGGENTKFEQKNCNQSGTTNCASEKNNLLDELENASQYFEQKQSSYDNFINLEDRKIRLKKPNGFALFVVGVILAFLFYCIISFNFYELDGWILILVSFVGFGVVLPIMIFNKGNAKVKNQLVSIDQKSSEIETVLHEHFNAYHNSPVSYEYSNPRVIAILKTYISSGRADNIKEAINCLIDDYHKQQMLSKQDEIAKNSKDTANAASFASLFVAGTFLKTRK